MTWLLAVITLVFTVVGVLIMLMGFSMNPFPGTDLAKRALEFKLLGGFFILTPWISIFFLKMKFRRERRFRESILKSGERRKAVLLSCEETGTYINEAPQVRMVLQIEDEDCGHRTHVFTGIVPVLKAVLIRPGMELEVTESSRGVVIHWPE